MRIRCLALLACIALGACHNDPTFDASSLPAYQDSLAKITAELSPENQRRLEMALLTLAIGDSARTDAMAIANPNSIANLLTLSGVANPLIYLDRLRPAIEGRSGAAVIRLVAANLDNQISRAEAKTAGAEKMLAAFTIGNPRYYWDSRLKMPTIEFSISNGSRQSISGIFVTGMLSGHGPTDRWTIGGLNYQFSKGLDPGEQVPVTLRINKFSVQTGRALERLYDADIAVKVTNIANENGERLVSVGMDELQALRTKRDFLRGS